VYTGLTKGKNIPHQYLLTVEYMVVSFRYRCVYRIRDACTGITGLPYPLLGTLTPLQWSSGVYEGGASWVWALS